MIVFVNKVLMDNSWGYRFTFGEMAPSALTTRQPSAQSVGSDLTRALHLVHPDQKLRFRFGDCSILSRESKWLAIVESEQGSEFLPLYLACTLFKIKPVLLMLAAQ